MLTIWMKNKDIGEKIVFYKCNKKSLEFSQFAFYFFVFQGGLHEHDRPIFAPNTYFTMTTDMEFSMFHIRLSMFWTWVHFI